MSQTLEIPGSNQGGFADRLGAVIRRTGILSAGEFAKAINRSPGQAAMYGGAVGGLLGLGTTAAGNLLFRRGRKKSLIAGTLLGAGLGAGGFAGSSYLANNNARRQELDKLVAEGETRGYHKGYLNPQDVEVHPSVREPLFQKGASFSKRALFQQGGSGREDMAFITNRLMSASDIGDLERRHMLRLVQQLPQGRVSELASILRTAFGGGLGILIAKYLLGMNLGGSILMALVGGALGSRSSGRSRNAFGQTHF